jgi:hypothetical protein
LLMAPPSQELEPPANPERFTMSRIELIIQLVKVVIGVAFGAYFLCLEVLNRLPPS